MTCSQTSTLGVYLLGALEPEDRSSFESHLYGCDVCRAELVRLAPLPGLLNQISLGDFDEPGVSLPAPEITLPAQEVPVPAQEIPVPVVMDAAQDSDPPDTPTKSVERTRYWQVAAAAVLVIALTIGGIVGYQALQEPAAPQPHTVTWSATNAVTGITADVELTERSWGTGFRVWMSNVPQGSECKLVVRAKTDYHERADYREVAGWWGTGSVPHEEIPGSTSIDLANIHKLEVRDSHDRLLVDVQPPQR